VTTHITTDSLSVTALVGDGLKVFVRVPTYKVRYPLSD